MLPFKFFDISTLLVSKTFCPMDDPVPGFKNITPVYAPSPDFFLVYPAVHRFRHPRELYESPECSFQPWVSKENPDASCFIAFPFLPTGCPNPGVGAV
jgi:hypothetical protein